MVADADDEADSRPNLWVWQRVRRAWHSPLSAAEVAVRELRLVNIDDVHASAEQLNHAQRELLPQDEVAVAVAAEGNPLYSLVPHTELLPKHLLDEVDSSTAPISVGDGLNYLFDAVNLFVGFKEFSNGVPDALELLFGFLLHLLQLLQVLWVLPGALDDGVDCANLNPVLSRHVFM